MYDDYINSIIAGTITSANTIPTNTHPTYLTNIRWILPLSGINDDGFGSRSILYKKGEYLLEEWFLHRYYHAVNSYVPFFILFSPTENISTPGPHPMAPQIIQANTYRPIFILLSMGTFCVIEALYQI